MTIQIGDKIYYSEEYIKELEERINKAIEYINTHNYPTDKGVFETDLDKRDLINILTGGDEE
jgi:hypothetical protein